MAVWPNGVGYQSFSIAGRRPRGPFVYTSVFTGKSHVSYSGDRRRRGTVEAPVTRDGATHEAILSLMYEMFNARSVLTLCHPEDGSLITVQALKVHPAERDARGFWRGWRIDFVEISGGTPLPSPIRITLSIQAPMVINTLTPFLATFKFAEDVTDFEATDIDITNGAASAFTAVDASTYTAMITPSSMADVIIAVAAGAANGSDSRRAPADATAVTVAWNLTWPGLTISVPECYMDATAFRTDFDFDAPITGFDADDIAVANGTLGTLMMADDQNYHALITPTGTEDIMITVRANAATDGPVSGPLMAVSVTAPRCAPMLPGLPIEETGDLVGDGDFDRYDWSLDMQTTVFVLVDRLRGKARPDRGTFMRARVFDDSGDFLTSPGTGQSISGPILLSADLQPGNYYVLVDAPVGAGTNTDYRLQVFETDYSEQPPIDVASTEDLTGLELRVFPFSLPTAADVRLRVDAPVPEGAAAANTLITMHPAGRDTFIFQESIGANGGSVDETKRVEAGNYYIVLRGQDLSVETAIRLRVDTS